MRNRLRGQHQGDGHHDLHRVMRRDAQRAVMVNLAVSVGVCDLEDAGKQHKGNADNSHESNEGMARPAP